MARYYAGSTLVLQQTVTVGGVRTDVPQLTFKWKMGRLGTETTVVPTRASVGVYTVAITPTAGGDLYYRWDTDGVLDTAQEGILAVAATNFCL